jgi:hypothetical protein
MIFSLIQRSDRMSSSRLHLTELEAKGFECVITGDQPGFFASYLYNSTSEVSPDERPESAGPSMDMETCLISGHWSVGGTHTRADVSKGIKG